MIGGVAIGARGQQVTMNHASILERGNCLTKWEWNIGMVPMFRDYGMTITAKTMQRQMRLSANGFNQGKPRRVSLKRPSPQLSRDKLATMRAIARMNILYREAGK